MAPHPPQRRLSTHRHVESQQKESEGCVDQPSCGRDYIKTTCRSTCLRVGPSESSMPHQKEEADPRPQKATEEAAEEVAEGSMEQNHSTSVAKPQTSCVVAHPVNHEIRKGGARTADSAWTAFHRALSFASAAAARASTKVLQPKTCSPTKSNFS